MLVPLVPARRGRPVCPVCTARPHGCGPARGATGRSSPSVLSAPGATGPGAPRTAGVLASHGPSVQPERLKENSRGQVPRQRYAAHGDVTPVPSDPEGVAQSRTFASPERVLRPFQGRAVRWRPHPVAAPRRAGTCHRLLSGRPSACEPCRRFRHGPSASPSLPCLDRINRSEQRGHAGRSARRSSAVGAIRTGHTSAGGRTPAAWQL